MNETTPAEEQEVYYAPHLKRLLAFILDVMLLSSLLAVGLSFMVDEQALQGTQEELMQEVTKIQSSQVFFWSLIGLFTAYFGLFQASAWQATPGKKLMGLYVTDLAGERLGWGQSLWRAAVETANFVILGGLPALLALFHPHGQTAHDVIARTFVLRK